MPVVPRRGVSLLPVLRCFFTADEADPSWERLIEVGGEEVFGDALIQLQLDAAPGLAGELGIGAGVEDSTTTDCLAMI